VDDYLSDKEQVERLRQWWRENGWFLIGGVALGGLAIYGYNQYNAYQDRQSEQAFALYEIVKQEVDDGDTEGASTRFAEMRSELPDQAYTYQAALLIAGAEVVTAPDAAAEKLRFTMDNSDDPELAMIARLRLARVLAYRNQSQEALALLNVPEPGQFASRIAEIRGDIHVALGETDAARTAYLEARVAPGAELLDRTFLEMKLADLPGAAPLTSAPGSETAPEGAVDPAAAPAETPPAAAAPAGASPAGEGA
jgi:predicted negative regulator of RcsB-dependent stress response